MGDMAEYWSVVWENNKHKQYRRRVVSFRGRMSADKPVMQPTNIRDSDIL